MKFWKSPATPAISKSPPPKRALQFGEGNFLRAFVDYWFDLANEKADWNGKCVLVQPIAIKINPADNVVVALHPIAKGTAVPVENTTVTAVEDIPQGHKMAIAPIKTGENVIKYGLSHRSRHGGRRTRHLNAHPQYQD